MNHHVQVFLFLIGGVGGILGLIAGISWGVIRLQNIGVHPAWSMGAFAVAICAVIAYFV